MKVASSGREERMEDTSVNRSFTAVQNVSSGNAVNCWRRSDVEESDVDVNETTRCT
jgi:hypothetical protein